MSKPLKISYKIFLNTRLKPVPFHGTEVLPLYIVVIHNRKPVYFKSYYFDLLTHSRYASQSAIGKIRPSTDDAIRKEHELINHLIEKHKDSFNIETFKQDYYYLGRDLLFEMEQAFQNYLTTFFQDEGYPVLASIISEGGKICRLENLLYDLKSIIKPNVFDKLYEHAVSYAPPYIPLYAFAFKQQKKNISTPLFSVLDWNINADTPEYQEFMKSHFSEYDPKLIRDYIEKMLNRY